MANTTNYAWETPDDTDLVKDGAAAIRTLGSSIDTTTKNLNPSTTLGDIEYRSSTANTNTRLAIGSTGNVLTVAGGVPTWAAPAGGGKVLQVVYATTTQQTTVATTTYTDTNLSATITPTSATSTILIFVNQGSYSSDTNGDSGGKIQLLRNTTVVYEPDLSNGLNSNYLGVTPSSGSITETYLGLTMNLVYRDSPATTSSTTYKTQGRRYGASGNIIFQQSSSYSSMLLMEIGA